LESRGQFGTLARHLVRLFGAGTLGGLDEGQLLERFTRQGDEVAFEALVARHGPMVLGVCRQFLHDPHDIDDAFQATFLVLVRKARSIRQRELLGAWLYGVAHRVALRARQVSSRRPGLVPDVSVGPDSSELERREQIAVMHEEIDRLPEKYRVPIILCYLEGLTHDQAAERLRWPVGTVRGRLARGRDRLRDRLTRRGWETSAGVLSAVGKPGKVMAAVPEGLLRTTVQAASQVAKGKVIGGVVSAQALTLMKGVLHTMFLSKVKWVAAVVVIGALTVGSGVLAIQATEPRPIDATQRDRNENKNPARSVQRPETAKLSRLEFSRLELVNLYRPGLIGHLVQGNRWTAGTLRCAGSV
jgi:RNA polymerase sigma factor (sigma-70 family)